MSATPLSTDSTQTGAMIPSWLPSAWELKPMVLKVSTLSPGESLLLRYFGAFGFKQVGEVRAACISRGTAPDGTFACLNQLAAVTCLHGAVTLAAGFQYDQATEVLFGTGEGKESKEEPPKSRVRRACQVADTYSTDFSFSSGNFGIKHTGHSACTLFPRGKAPYINNIWSQMGEIAFAEASALYIQWTMYDKASDNVYIRWHSELDTVASDICPLYVSGSGCKF